MCPVLALTAVNFIAFNFQKDKKKELHLIKDMALGKIPMECLTIDKQIWCHGFTDNPVLSK